MAESVELATILLTDLVGSTRLATSIGPVRADQLREEHFELLRDAIASSDGRDVKNTGDGLMVAFSSASAAVQCAVAMQQRFERHYRDAEQALHVRIGLGAGESTVKDGDYFGIPTIVAARLCAQAPADGILISGMARELAGRCDGIEFTSAGELELNGFEAPVEAFSVSWAPLVEETGASSRWPLPAVLRSVPPVKYVGRVEERAALEEAMKLARAGQRQVVLLSGEPGIGKTRLASYAAHQARAEGFAVAWGACTEELAVPYEPWIGICSQLVENAPAELLAGHIERHGGELSRLVRSLASRSEEVPLPQSSDPETERYLLFNAVAGLLADVAEMVPLCVVLGELHWADAQSLSLLKHLLRATEQRALQVIVTYRDCELGKDHPLTAMLADLYSLQGVQRIALHGLGADEVAELMSAVAGHELAQDAVELAAQIAAETDGNPFFVGEILRGLSESGALRFDEAAQRWSIDSTAAIGLPESVREVIERRVERLGDETLEALRLAAVIGREFDLKLMSRIVGTHEPRLLEHLEAAVAASVLAESSDRVGRFRFAHALINHTLYEGLGVTRRARIHRCVAEALDSLYAANPGEHLAELALHWRLGAMSVDRVKAVDYALKAGQQALVNLAPALAVKLFSEAVELSGKADGRERCEALIGLGEAQRLTGEAEYRQTLLDASQIASELQDGERAARAALANNRGVSSVLFRFDHERVATIERALELDDDPDRRARLLALQAIELVYEHDHRHRRELAEQALTLAREVGNSRTTACVLIAYFLIHFAPDVLERRVEQLEELCASAQAAADPALEFWAAFAELNVMVESGEVERAEETAQRMTAIAEVEEPTIRWAAVGIARASMALLRGDLAEAERYAKEALKIGRDAGEPDAFIAYAMQIFPVRLMQGRLTDLVPLEQSVQASPLVHVLKASLAWSLCWLGRSGEAAAILTEAAADRFEHLPWDHARMSALTMYAEAAAQTGLTDAAAILYELIEPWADHVVWSSLNSYGHARMYLGLLAAALGWDERADEHFAGSCDFEEQRGMLMWAARAHLGWAEALAARGAAERAREEAQRALELSREHGYALFEPRAAALVETASRAGA